MPLNNSILKKEYIDNQKSPAQIAIEYNTYPNLIRRQLKKLGYPIRGRSDAQVLALKNGRRKHPTKGLSRPESTKIKISDSMANNWKGLTKQEYKNRVEKGKKSWSKLTKSQKESIRLLASKAIRNASVNGSKLENTLFALISNLGYKVEFHKQDLLVNERLHLDLFIPKLGLAIEVDGPAHYFPIWGEHSLEKHIKADNEKSGLLLSKGFRLLRIKHIKTRLSKKREREIVEDITEIINGVAENRIVDKLLEYET